MCNVAVSYFWEVKLVHTFVYCVDYLELLGMMLVTHWKGRRWSASLAQVSRKVWHGLACWGVVGKVWPWSSGWLSKGWCLHLCEGVPPWWWYVISLAPPHSWWGSDRKKKMQDFLLLMPEDFCQDPTESGWSEEGFPGRWWSSELLFRLEM